MKILIVDDSELVAERLNNMLEDIAGTKIIATAGTYARAAELLEELNPDLALLDINLPDKSGLELLLLIKQNYKKTQVIMISNNATESYRKICSKLGANYFFDKSHDFELIPHIIVKMWQN
jgi:DNA-binding NarL/FixJ family response regulator